jgi:pimeloyl-ACP methyl ester carboxylesterase
MLTESVLTKPAFYGAALRDYVSLPVIFKNSFPKSTDLTIVDFDTGHWPQLERPEEVNKALEGWIQSKL